MAIEIFKNGMIYTSVDLISIFIDLGDSAARHENQNDLFNQCLLHLSNLVNMEPESLKCILSHLSSSIESQSCSLPFENSEGFLSISK